MKRYDRIHGCLAGLALGDSLGCPTEFLTPEQIRDEFGWVDHFVQAPAWHPHVLLPAGHITDDTGQTLAVAQALDEKGKTDSAAVARTLRLWADENSSILSLITGPSTRAALDLLQAGTSSENSGQNGLTNGASYRAVIPGMVNHKHPQDLLQQVVEVCRVTHDTTVAISGAAAVAFAVSAAFQLHASLDGVISAACQGAIQGRQHGKWRWGTPLEKRIQLALDLVQSAGDPKQALTRLYDYVGVDMLVAESIASAFGIVKLADGDPMKAVQYGANIGGDTDTIAAIAGAVCGAWQGTDAIDRNMLAEVERVNQLDLARAAHRLDAIISRRHDDGE
ncbi:MAG: ADP-ribosylglycohydrolase family protein [Anaerolineae bacterium]|nr:ADP-ribosylglycohydrolase family protein [Anaerolineae bacterium]